MNIPMRKRIAAALLLTALTGSIAACGDDDSDAVAAPTDSAMAAEACDAVVDLSAMYAGPDSDDAGAWATDTLLPISATLSEHVDGDLQGDVSTLSEAFESIAETGDPSALDSEELNTAVGRIGEAAHQDCDFEKVDIEAFEYRYEGLPSEVPAGPVSFALANEGVEEHEIVIFRRADGVSESLEELLAMPEDEVFSKIEFTGVAFGAPDTTAYTTVDLAPGTYFVVCFIPVGGGEEGPPHAMEGMTGTFVVA